MPFFTRPPVNPLVQAIQDALEAPECLDRLLDMLDPAIREMAVRYAPQIVEEAVVAGKARVWRKLDKVDLSRPETARSYIMRTALSGIRDEVRKNLTAWNREVSLQAAESIVHRFRGGKSNDFVFDGILQHYLEHVKATGDFHGAHAAVGRKLGITTARASTLFHEASAALIRKHKELDG